MGLQYDLLASGACTTVTRSELHLFLPQFHARVTWELTSLKAIYIPEDYHNYFYEVFT